MLPPRTLLWLILLSPGGPSPAILDAQARHPFDFLQSAIARHRIVFLGDVHPVAEPKLLVSRLVREQRAGAWIDLLVLEVASDQQGTIDEFLASDPEDTTILLDHPATLRAHWGASAEYLDIYRAVHHWNREHAHRSVRVIAADLRGWPMSAVAEQAAAGAFADRDRRMATGFLEVLEGSPGGGECSCSWEGTMGSRKSAGA